MHEPHQCAAMLSTLLSVTMFRKTNLILLLVLDSPAGNKREIHLVSTEVIKHWPSQ